MASGVQVDEECKHIFDKVKKQRIHKYVIFHIENEVKIKIEKKGDKDAAYKDFTEDIRAAGDNMCRYGLFDYEYMHTVQGTSEPTKKQKLLLMLWCPDTAKVKDKMLYSSSFDALKKCLIGVQKYIECTDTSEMSQEEVENKLRQNDRI